MEGLDTSSGRQMDTSEVSPALEMFSKMPISQLQETNSHLQASLEHAEKKIGNLNEVLLHQENEFVTSWN